MFKGHLILGGIKKRENRRVYARIRARSAYELRLSGLSCTGRMPGRLLDLGGIIGVVMGKDAPMLDHASPAVAERVEVAGPELSVVVASVNRWDVLEPTLEALDARGRSGTGWRSSSWRRGAAQCASGSASGGQRWS